MKTVAYKIIDNIILSYSGINQPSENEWEQFIKDYANVLAQHNIVHPLTISEGGGPSASQRKKLVNLVGKEGQKKNCGCSIYR